MLENTASMADSMKLPPVSDRRLLETWELMGRTLSLYQRIELGLKFLVHLPRSAPRMPLDRLPPAVSVLDIQKTLGGLITEFEKGGFIVSSDDQDFQTRVLVGLECTDQKHIFHWAFVTEKEKREQLFALARLVCKERNILVHHFFGRHLAENNFDEAQAELLKFYENARDLHEILRGIAEPLLDFAEACKKTIEAKKCQD